MHPVSLRNVGKLCVLLIGIVLLSGAVAGRVTGQTQPQPLLSSLKIAPELQAALKTDGTADVIIVLEKSADLSGAAQLRTKAERGQYVYDALRAHADASQAALRAWLDQQGLTYQPFYISNKIYVPNGSAALVAGLAARPDVAQIVPNTVRRLPDPTFAPAKPGRTPLAIEPNLTFVNADDVWAMGITGDGVVLAGNDTGLQWDHPAIRNQYRGWNGTTADHNYSWWDATGTYPTVPGDGNGHGTHTTGTMVGNDGGTNQIGIAPGARTIHCKNLFDGGYGYDADIIECFQWNLAPWDLTGNNPRPDLAPDAINNSWGGGGGSTAFHAEIDALQAAGILIEFSAGNNGPGCYSLGSPGDYPPVLTTGSVSHSGGTLPGTVSGFSSRGPSPFTADPLPDIMAPGENVRSSVPGSGYAYADGTSMAGPHVTGLIGLLWSANPGLRGMIEETSQIIMQTAVPLTDQTGSSCGGDYTTGPNNDWGHGTIDALAAVNLAVLYGDPGVLTGQVANDTTGEPLAGVRITARNTADIAWRRNTDENGLYNMTVFSGTYTVTAQLYGYYPQAVPDITVTAFETTTLDFALTPAPIYTVSGHVRDTVTGWPILAGIRIDGYPGAPVWSNYDDGFYAIGLAAGNAYTLHATAWAEGYQPVSVALDVLDGDVTADLWLQPDPVLCSAPGYQADYILFNDFEADAGGFTVSGNSTSWQWGRPTSGPGRARSGNNVWATNLVGNYGNGESGYITSPPVDLSAYTGQTIIVAWWEWLETETCCDYATVEVTPNGSDWYTYQWNTQYPNTGWTRRQIHLDSFYATPAFQVRFGFFSDSSITYPGYYVDDLGIGVVPGAPAYYATDFETDAGFSAAGVNSSWEWGHPTRGPGYAHSGLNVWATGLAANYNNNENSALTSPTIDLSAAAGQWLYLNWWQWMQTEANYDFVAVEASADDGATWTTVFGPFSGVWAFDWGHYGLMLDPSFAVSTFRLRFTLTSDDSITYPGLYIDDLRIEAPQVWPPTLACQPLEGGLVYGMTTDRNRMHPLNGVTVSSAVMTTRSGPWPQPAFGDGSFLLFAPTGLQPITGQLDGYETAVEYLDIAPNSVSGVTLSLGAGFLMVEPAAIEATMAMGSVATTTLTLQNTGQIELAFSVEERNGGFTPAAGRVAGRGEWLQLPDTAVAAVNNRGETAEAYPSAYHWQPDRPTADLAVLVYADDYVHTAPNTFLDIALQALGLPYTAYYDGNYNGFNQALAAQSWDVVLFGNDYYLPPVETLNALDAYVNNSGKLVFHSWGVATYIGLPLWQTLGIDFHDNDFDPPDPIYWWDAAHPAFNLPQSVPQLLTPNGGIYGVYGQRVEPLPGALAVAGYTAAAENGQATLVIANDGRTVFKGFLDGQHSADADTDGLPDSAELWINLFVGVDARFSYDVPWLSVDLVDGVLSPTAEQPITVTLDGSGPFTPQPGAYTAALRLRNNTPYGVLSVPVTLNLTAPANWGRLSGVVSGLAHCDAPGVPLRGAEIVVEGAATLRSAADGAFVYWLPAGTYTVTMTHGDYLAQTVTATVTAGASTHLTPAMRPVLPCGTLDPGGPLTYSVLVGEQATQTVTLGNTGAGEWDYRLLETPFVATVPARLPVAAPSLSGLPIPDIRGPASVLGRFDSSPFPATILPLTGWFGAAAIPGGVVRYGFAQCAEDPEQFYVISGVSPNEGVTRNVWRYAAEDNTWTALPPIPVGRETPAATCYQDRLYVLGGGGSDQFYIFDLNRGVWLEGARLPRGVEGAAAAAWDGVVYLVAGDDNFMPGDGVSALVNRYDIATDTWLSDGVPAPAAVSNMGYAQAGNLLYLVGGWAVGSPEVNVTATQRYDLATGTWSTGPAFEAARADFALAATDRALYAIGGDATGGFFFDSSDLVDRLATAEWPNGTWSRLGDRLPDALTANNAGFCTQALFDRGQAEIWSIGGGNAYGITNHSFFREMAQERCPTIYVDVPWLTVTPANGAVPGDATTTLQVAVNAADLAPGRYTAGLVVVGNDGQRRLTVELEVRPIYRFYLPVLIR